MAPNRTFIVYLNFVISNLCIKSISIDFPKFSYFSDYLCSSHLVGTAHVSHHLLRVDGNDGNFDGKLYLDSNVHGANMGPTWVLSAPDGPHVGPMNLAIRVVAQEGTSFLMCQFENNVSKWLLYTAGIIWKLPSKMLIVVTMANCLSNSQHEKCPIIDMCIIWFINISQHGLIFTSWIVLTYFIDVVFILSMKFGPK